LGGGSKDRKQIRASQQDGARLRHVPPRTCPAAGSTPPGSQGDPSPCPGPHGRCPWPANGAGPHDHNKHPLYTAPAWASRACDAPTPYLTHALQSTAREGSCLETALVRPLERSNKSPPTATMNMSMHSQPAEYLYKPTPTGEWEYKALCSASSHFFKQGVPRHSPPCTHPSPAAAFPGGSMQCQGCA
jgi:hypothetical protein